MIITLGFFTVLVLLSKGRLLSSRSKLLFSAFTVKWYFKL